MKFKKNDWCYFDFKLCQIQEVITNGKVQSVTDGHICTGGNDLTCLPMTIETKNISGIFKKLYDELYTKVPRMNLNFHDIHRHFVQRWEDACDGVNRGNKANEIIAKIHDFQKEILDVTAKPI